MATVAATGGGATREARRRRILERGTDRLALISGQIQSLPPEPDQSRPPTSTPSDSSEKKDDKMANLNEGLGTEPSEGCDLEVENTPSREANEPLGALGSTSTSQEASKELLTTAFTGNKPRGITSRAAALLGVEEELSRITSSVRSLGQEQSQRHTKTLQNTCTPAQIRSAIAATENVRLCSSAVIAILVILSGAGFPFLGSPGIRTVILLKPVLMLLLTNIAIMAAWIFSADSRTRHNRSSAVGMGKAIETGLMLQRIFGALMMDFFIYAILLICGNSLVQRLV